MASLPSKVTNHSDLRRLGAVVWAWAGTGAAWAHPGHEHDSWLAPMWHLLSDWAPALAGLALAAAVLRLMARRKVRGH